MELKVGDLFVHSGKFLCMIRSTTHDSVFIAYIMYLEKNKSHHVMAVEFEWPRQNFIATWSRIESDLEKLLYGVML